MDRLHHFEWRKSTYSGVNGCVEVAILNDQIAIRDSKDPRGPMLLFTYSEWAAFIRGVRDGQFSLE